METHRSRLLVISLAAVLGINVLLAVLNYRMWLADAAASGRTWHLLAVGGSVMSGALLLGVFVQLLGAAREVTEQKRSHALLQGSESQYRRLFEAAKDGILILNADTGMIEDVNPFLTGLLGLTREEVLRKRVWELGCFQNLVANQEKYSELQRNEYVRYEDLPLKAADGRRVAVEFVSNVYEVNGARVIQCNIRDITARKQAEVALRELAARLQTIREEERAGIARELHDELGQSLTGLKLDLAWLGRRLPADAPESAACREKIATMLPHADQLIQTVQRLSSELRPAVLDDLGLVAAIEWHAGEFSRRSGVPCALSLPEDEPALPAAVSTALYRILQESLTNVARHAQATRVELMLTLTDGRVRLEIRDNGRGITPDERADEKALGLLGMNERARALGGNVTFAGAPGTGTTVTVAIPLPTP